MSPIIPTTLPASVLYQAAFKTDRSDANKAPLKMLDDVEGLVRSYRGDPRALRAGIEAAALALMATSAALSLIPFEANFGGELAARIMHQLIRPGVEMAINAPLRDYLDDVFPTHQISARLLVSGVESGALEDEDIVATLIDGGVKDEHINRAVKIARVARFENATKDDFSLVKQYHTALVNESVANATADANDQIAARKARIKDLQAQLKAAAKGATMA